MQECKPRQVVLQNSLGIGEGRRTMSRMIGSPLPSQRKVAMCQVPYFARGLFGCAALLRANSNAVCLKHRLGTLTGLRTLAHAAKLTSAAVLEPLMSGIRSRSSRPLLIGVDKSTSRPKKRSDLQPADKFVVVLLVVASVVACKLQPATSIVLLAALVRYRSSVR